MTVHARPDWSVSWDEGYEAGKRAATANAYAAGWQACFAELRERIGGAFDAWAEEPIPTQQVSQ